MAGVRRGRPPNASAELPLADQFRAAIDEALAMIDGMEGRDADKARVRLNQAVEHVALAKEAPL